MYDKYSIKNGETLANKFTNQEEYFKGKNNVYINNQLRANIDIIVPQNKDNYFNYYVIEKGDSLYAIAKKYNINPELLASMNGLNMNDYIYPNQEILIPKSGYSYYITKEGDTLSTVADIFKQNKDEVLATNPTVYLLAGQIMVKRN